MIHQDFLRSKSLNCIPYKKIDEKLKSIDLLQEPVDVKNLKIIAYNRYAESNIPIEYWDLKMDKDFIGDSRLLDKYKDLVSDIKGHYVLGTSICFAGNHGTGKTMSTTNILKKACQKGYSCLYTTLSDIVNVLTQAPSEEKYLARRELCMVDFLVIDEFDSRFMHNENASDLYARHLENIFRTRSQNKLPTFMCTNSPNILEMFSGPMKQSIESLIKGYMKIFIVLGEDIRKRK
jgi:DNA replication protein DnaC